MLHVVNKKSLLNAAEYFRQENRRHARVIKKASKLAVSELLEIAAMKGIAEMPARPLLEGSASAGAAAAPVASADTLVASGRSSASASSASAPSAASAMPDDELALHDDERDADPADPEL